MKIAFYGSSLLSSYWNGAATYYRGLLFELANHGHQITFYEPDSFDRQRHRDIDPPPWAKVVVYQANETDLRRVIAEAQDADVVIKASGVGVFDEELLHGLGAAARPEALYVFWDVDAPATLADMRQSPDHPVRRALSRLDAVLTYGGGPPVVSAYREFGAPLCEAVYNALDPATHFPAQKDDRFASDLAFLGNRLPDREARVAKFFFEPAQKMADRLFLIGGAGWADAQTPKNVKVIGHVYTREHNAFNTSPLAVLNIARDSMADVGYSPATRVFEAAGASACLITDAWVGIELFLEPDKEVLVARDGDDVVDCLAGLTVARAREIGEAARRRILSQHTYRLRGQQVDSLLKSLAASKAERTAA